MTVANSLLAAWEDVVEQAREVVAAYEARADDATLLTLSEKQELAVLRIRIAEFDERATS